MGSSTPFNHLGLIMDGNGRWATRQGLERSAGHLAGFNNTITIVQKAFDLGIKEVTVYALSSDNVSKRPIEEVDGILGILYRFLKNYSCEKDFCIRIIGSNLHLSTSLKDLVDEINGQDLKPKRLNILVDYTPTCTYENCKEVSQIDLVIRTGGFKRLSGFMPLYTLYSELYFSSKLWPEFNVRDLRRAITSYKKRRRTFGGL